MSSKFQYECSDCGAKYNADRVMYLCPDCEQSNRPELPPKGVLRIIYNYEEIKRQSSSENLFSTIESKGYLPLLPLRDLSKWPKLRVGKTPLYKYDQLGSDTLEFNLYLKDDSQNPTFSFKDRASALVSAWAKENGVDTIIAASTGNAGSSLAGICASQGQRSIIFVPASAPAAKLTQIMMYGATIVPVEGNYDQAFDLSVQATKTFGFYNRNTAFNPLTIEGKKTVSFEIYSDLGHSVPDRIFVPVGDGVIISGVYKGFEDLLALGIIGKMPVIVAVQAEGSKNIVSNMNRENFRISPSATLADSISVDVPRNFYMATNFLRKYQGETVTVTDEEIISASVRLSRTTGIFAEPAAAAAFAGMRKYMQSGKIPAASKNLVLLTGSGLKDLKSVQASIHLPAPLKPDIESLLASGIVNG